ncbi:MAG: lytic transglycosylase domain-containing protein [Gammaproteobacteria bacterium]|nr:lytic transglycosylase domain-containing protein [Gammaproteobacteria bacterium]
MKSLTREIAVKLSGSIGVRKAGLDAFTFVDVFEALIQRESAFNPRAISPKGAKGLGQLMPGTAADMGVSDLFDARLNLIGSAKYLTSLLAEFGSLELALAAYNAGPERVRQYGGVPPFAETQAYIAWISAKAGVELNNPVPAQSVPAAVPVNKEQPLKGEISVWEF